MAGESQQIPDTKADPTVFTTEAIERAQEAERDYQGALHDIIEARDRATNQRITDLAERLQERYETQVQAVDRALAAAEKAVDARAVTLDKEFHEHLEQVRHENALAFINSDKAIAAALSSQEKAVDKAETANEKRFEAVNEFRAQLNDQAATFIARPEYQAALGALGEKIQTLEKVQDRATGRGEGYSSSWAVLVALGGLVVAATSVAVAIIIATR